MSLLAKISTGLLISALSMTTQAAEPEVQNPDLRPSETTVDVMNTPEVVQVLYVRNASEIKIAGLVQERNSEESLQEFADELARDHSWMNRMLEAIANIKSISLEADELSEAAQLVNTQLDESTQMLAAKPEGEFRSAFLEVIILEHQKTLDLYNQIEEGTTDDALKATLAIFRQMEEKHLADAQKLQLPAQPEQPTPPEQPLE